MTYLINKLEKLGAEGNYEGQAEEFMQSTNLDIKKRFIGTKKYFTDDKDERDVYEVKFTRGTRQYVFTYGDSVHNTQERIRKYDTKAIQTIQEKNLKEWESKPEIEALKPSNYNILACLDGFMDYDDVDKFANDFGYEKPSEAVKTFEAVKKQTNELQKLFNDAELQALSFIN